MLAIQEKRCFSLISENELRQRIVYRWDVHKTKIAIDGMDILESLQNPVVADATASGLAQSENLDAIIRFCNHIMEPYDDIICEGRNAGTEFLPCADIKYALVANLPARITRRHAQLNAKGEPVPYAETERQIRERDEMDSGRQYAPFRIPHGATIIDTSHRSIEECVSLLSDSIVRTRGKF